MIAAKVVSFMDKPRWNKPTYSTLTTLLICLLALITLSGCQAEKAPHYPQISTFQLTRLDGTTINSEQFKGKIVIVNVWATWCPPCRREMPSLQALSRNLNPQQMVVIGLTVDQDLYLVREFLSQTGVSFANFHDPQGQIADLLAVKLYPTTVILDQQGQILHHVVGERDWNSEEIRTTLAKVYAGETHLVSQL